MLTSVIFLLIALVLSLTIHEFAHALAAHYLGDRTARDQGRLTLNPIAHIDPIMTVLLPLFLIVSHAPVIFGAAKPVPFNPSALRYGRYGAAMVALAGPLSNLLLAIFFALWLRWVPVSPELLGLFISIITVNIGFMVFNLIPIPPLDGSRVVYAVAPAWLREAMDRIEQVGIMVIFLVLLVAGVFIGPIIADIVSAILQILVPGLTGLST